MSPFGPRATPGTRSGIPWHGRPYMSKRRYFGQAALALASTLLLSACSSDTPTSPADTRAEPDGRRPLLSRSLSRRITSSTSAIPTMPYSVRGCPTGSVGEASANSGGGTLNWTSTKSATWIKRSPRYGTAPSTMKVWVDGTGLPNGNYYGWIKVWATGATNSPQTVVHKNAKRLAWY